MRGRTHGSANPRGQRCIPRSVRYEGRFGRLFRRLPAAPALDDETLRTIADGMREPESISGGHWDGPQAPPAELDHPSLPAGYTYFGQFVDHDLTFDPTSSLDRQNDPDALHNFRTPRFDLDSLYGSGPEDEPFAYDEDQPGKLLLAPNRLGVIELPRNVQDIALIGDPRNDENLIVSQMQVAFARLHNKFIDEVDAEGGELDERGRFEEAQRRTRWHYQQVVVGDFLPRIAGPELIERLFSLEGGRASFALDLYKPRSSAFMPVEFSTAAYRFGHSLVRPLYDLNQNITAKPVFAPGDDVAEDADLRGRRALLPGWDIHWPFFLPVEGAQPQHARSLDAKLAGALFDLPGDGAGGPSLAFLNLKRGQALLLPSGQDVARALGATPLTAAELSAPEPTPLWFYILKEAEISGGGERLGEVGGRIVAEVLLGLLQADSHSWVNVDPAWQSTIPAREGRLQLSDLIEFATT